MLSLSGATGSDFSIYAGMPPIMPWQTAASSRLMSRQRPRVVGGSNVIATYNIASYNVIRRPAQTPARTRNALRCHWGLWDALSARGLNRKRHPVLNVESGTQFPFGDRSGKCIPFWSQILGRSFRQACHPESASRSEPEFWDALSAERLPFFEKVHVPKLTKTSYPATVHGRRLPPTDSNKKYVAKSRSSTCMVRFWSAFGQLSGKFQLIRFCYPKGGGSS